jgi:hypothetical protein
MGINLKFPPQTQQNYPIAVRYERRHLLKAFWIGVFVLFLVQVYMVENIALPSISGAILSGIAALYPSYLWCSGKALGMPIFPIFALTYLWTYALPLLSKNPLVIAYSPESHFFASIAVAICLGLGTITWFQFVNSPPSYPKKYYALIERKGDTFFLFILAVGVFFNMYSLGGWFALGGGAFALIRNAILGLNILSVFVLSYRLGAKELTEKQSKAFFLLLALYMISSGATLILRANIGVFCVATAAFILGRRKLPTLTIVIVFLLLSLLHYGKDVMRAKYWVGDQQHFVQPWEYPAWYAEWAGYSLDYVNKLNKNESQGTKKKESSFYRSSVVQMFLMAQDKTPRDVPYLSGKSYAILPQLILPRFLNPNKIRSHEGTYILNIHYGRQTREQTNTTTIAWGMLAEAYANFGLFGCAGLGIFFGAAYGQATRWGINTPLLSARSLFAVLMMSFAFQTEWTAGVYVAALFQSSATLVGITFVFMKVYRLKEFTNLRQQEAMNTFWNQEF